MLDPRLVPLQMLLVSAGLLAGTSAIVLVIGNKRNVRSVSGFSKPYIRGVIPLLSGGLASVAGGCLLIGLLPLLRVVLTVPLLGLGLALVFFGSVMCLFAFQTAKRRASP